MQIPSIASSPPAKLDERPAVASGLPYHKAGRLRGLGVTSPRLEFEIDEESKDLVVKIIDRDTKEVVRQMPTKEALEMAKSIDKMVGRLLNQSA